MNCVSPAAGVLEVVWQVGVEGDRVALARDRARRRRRRAAAGPSSTTAVSRLPASWIGGSSGPPVAAPGGKRVQRDLGALARQRRRQHLVAVAVGVAAEQALAVAHDRRRRRPRRAAAAARATARGRRRSWPRPPASGWSRRARPATASAPTRRSARRGRAARGPSPRAARGRGCRRRGFSVAAVVMAAYVITYALSAHGAGPRMSARPTGGATGRAGHVRAAGMRRPGPR